MIELVRPDRRLIVLSGELNELGMAVRIGDVDAVRGDMRPVNSPAQDVGWLYEDIEGHRLVLQPAEAQVLDLLHLSGGQPAGLLAEVAVEVAHDVKAVDLAPPPFAVNERLAVHRRAIERLGVFHQVQADQVAGPGPSLARVDVFEVFPGVRIRPRPTEDVGRGGVIAGTVGRHPSTILGRVEQQAGRELPLVAQTGGPQARLPRPGKTGQQNADQDRNNPNHNKQLDKGKGAAKSERVQFDPRA